MVNPMWFIPSTGQYLEHENLTVKLCDIMSVCEKCIFIDNYNMYRIFQTWKVKPINHAGGGDIEILADWVA